MLVRQTELPSKGILYMLPLGSQEGFRMEVDIVARNLHRKGRPKIMRKTTCLRHPPKAFRTSSRVRDATLFTLSSVMSVETCVVTKGEVLSVHSFRWDSWWVSCLRSERKY